MDTDLLEVSNGHNTAVMADFDKVSFHWYYVATLLYLLL